MPTIDILRPDATVTNVGWTLTGGATAQAILSDNSDASYVEGTFGDILIMDYPDHTPAANHQRHRIQNRVRISSPTVGVSVMCTTQFKNPVGTTTGVGTNIVDRTFSDWYMQANLSQAGPVNLVRQGAAASQGQRFDVLNNETARLYEAYLYVDTRAEPSFTPEVQDGAGVDRNGGIISDSSSPTFVFGTVDYDELTARTWTLEVRTVPGGVVAFSASGIGTPPSTIDSDPLANGDYEADLQVFSTIRTNDAFASDVENVTFEIAFVPPATPVLTSTPIASPPSVELDWVSGTPTGTTWDVNADVVTEIERTDCNGTVRIYVEQTGLTAAEHIDRFLGLSYDGVFCGESDHECQACYRARYWGLVDGVVVASDWSNTECETIVNPTPANAWLRGVVAGDLSVCPDESYSFTRPFGAFQPIGGGLPTVVTGSPGGRDYSLFIPVTSEADQVTLDSILAQPLLWYQPVAQADLWLTPRAQSVQVVKIGRIRVTSVDLVAVNPQPVADPASFF